ncbi:hypothetical protein K438DRAFT_538524 [Mycena galopus ATCC 62051]|nr:hypothetical protein K438DRAFT_538524 [Mycena galopus ATCC 62051]
MSIYSLRTRAPPTLSATTLQPLRAGAPLLGPCCPKPALLRASAALPRPPHAATRFESPLCQRAHNTHDLQLLPTPLPTVDLPRRGPRTPAMVCPPTTAHTPIHVAHPRSSCTQTRRAPTLVVHAGHARIPVVHAHLSPRTREFHARLARFWPRSPPWSQHSARVCVPACHLEKPSNDLIASPRARSPPHLRATRPAA